MLKEAGDRQRHRRQEGKRLTAGVPRRDGDQRHYLQHSLHGPPPAAALPKSYLQTPAILNHLLYVPAILLKQADAHNASTCCSAPRRRCAFLACYDSFGSRGLTGFVWVFLNPEFLSAANKGEGPGLLHKRNLQRPPCTSNIFPATSSTAKPGTFNYLSIYACTPQ